MNTDGCSCVKDAVVESWVKNSRLVCRWQEIRHEILLHKWYESEKAGHDIGWDRAAVSWKVRCSHPENEESRR